MYIFYATPSAILPGQIVTLTWSTQNATNVSIDQGIGSVEFNGSLQVTPSQDITYTMTVFGANNQSVECSVSIEVSSTPVPVCLSFEATPNAITPGQSVTLNWNTQNAQSASISQLVKVNPTVTTTYACNRFMVKQPTVPLQLQ